MNAAQISGNMKTQISTLDEIKKLYDRAVKDKLASDDELAALKAYIECIDTPWHVMAKIADSIAKAENAGKAKKDEKKKDENPKATGKDAKTADKDSSRADDKEDSKEAAQPDEKDDKPAAGQGSAIDEVPADASAEAETDTEADDDLSFLD